MNTYRNIQTNGDPLGAIQNILSKIWQQAKLDGILAPINGNQGKTNRMQLIDDYNRLDEMNPFKPIMTENAARRIPSLLEEYQDKNLGVILRPCEMRALTEMVKHDSFSIEGLLTICIDCLKTIPITDYQWRLKRKPTGDGLTQEVLRFARQGGISAYRYRSACQMCISPQAKGADLNVAVLGLPVRRQLLIHSSDDAVADRLNLENITDAIADPKLILQHEYVLAKIDERHQRTMKRVVEGLGDVLPKNIDALIVQLESCTPCETCMNVCPICAVDRPEKDSNGHYAQDDISRWLLSCDGCGMCEQACPSHLPLSSIFRQLRDQLSQIWNYVPGMSMDQPLPIM